MMRRLVSRGISSSFSASNRSLSLAVRYSELGDPKKVLKFENVDTGAVGPNDILVKMLAAPINPADINMIEGQYGIKAQLLAVAGNEGVGIITEVGNAVKNLKVNDWVIPGGGSGGFGTWRYSVKADAGSVVKVPKDIPPAYAATLSVNPATAYRLLADFAKLVPGDVIIQNGANSMVGLAVIQLARERGIKTINVIRADRPDSDTTLRLLDNLGGDINIRDDFLGTGAFNEVLAELPPIKLGLNCVGGESATDLARALGYGATLVSYGGMAKKPVTVPHELLAYKGLSLKGFWMAQWYKQHTAAERDAMFNDLVELIRDEKLTFFYSLHDFDDFNFALKTALEPFNFRKIVLNMDFPDRFAEHDARPAEDYEVFNTTVQ